MRVDRLTLEIDGGSDRGSQGRCFATLTEWEHERTLRVAWNALRGSIAMAYAPPDGIQACDIEHAFALLRLQPMDLHARPR